MTQNKIVSLDGSTGPNYSIDIDFQKNYILDFSKRFLNEYKRSNILTLENWMLFAQIMEWIIQKQFSPTLTAQDSK